MSQVNPFLRPLPTPAFGKVAPAHAQKSQLIQITSGSGPQECCWVVGQVADVLIREGKEKHLKIETVEQLPSDKPGLYKSILLKIQGDKTDDFLKTWAGTIQWMGRSLFRPEHKRNSWFVAVQPVQQSERLEINPDELEFQPTRASGPGGQKVNKTSSAVHVIHQPTGIRLKVQDQRSQHKNRAIGVERIQELVQRQNDDAEAQDKLTQRESHTQLLRGNATRVYRGKSFKRVR